MNPKRRTSFNFVIPSYLNPSLSSLLVVLNNLVYTIKVVRYYEEAGQSDI